MKYINSLIFALILSSFYSCNSTRTINENEKVIREEIALFAKEHSTPNVTEDYIIISIKQLIERTTDTKRRNALTSLLRETSKGINKDRCPDNCSNCCMPPPCIPSNCNGEMTFFSLHPNRIITDYKVNVQNQSKPHVATVTRLNNTKTGVVIGSLDIEPDHIISINLTLIDKSVHEFNPHEIPPK